MRIFKYIQPSQFIVVKIQYLFAQNVSVLFELILVANFDVYPMRLQFWMETSDVK